MDDDWGYPHFSKPSYCFLIIFSDMVLSAVGVIQIHHSDPLPKPPAASCSQLRVSLGVPDSQHCDVPKMTKALDFAS